LFHVRAAKRARPHAQASRRPLRPPRDSRLADPPPDRGAAGAKQPSCRPASPKVEALMPSCSKPIAHAERQAIHHRPEAGSLRKLYRYPGASGPHAELCQLNVRSHRCTPLLKRISRPRPIGTTRVAEAPGACCASSEYPTTAARWMLPPFFAERTKPFEDAGSCMASFRYQRASSRKIPPPNTAMLGGPTSPRQLKAALRGRTTAHPAASARASRADVIHEVSPRQCAGKNRLHATNRNAWQKRSSASCAPTERAGRRHAQSVQAQVPQGTTAPCNLTRTAWIFANAATRGCGDDSPCCASRAMHEFRISKEDSRRSRSSFYAFNPLRALKSLLEPSQTQTAASGELESKDQEAHTGACWIAQEADQLGAEGTQRSLCRNDRSRQGRNLSARQDRP